MRNTIGGVCQVRRMTRTNHSIEVYLYYRRHFWLENRRGILKTVMHEWRIAWWPRLVPLWVWDLGKGNSGKLLEKSWKNQFHHRFKVPCCGIPISPRPRLTCSRYSPELATHCTYNAVELANRPGDDSRDYLTVRGFHELGHWIKGISPENMA